MPAEMVIRPVRINNSENPDGCEEEKKNSWSGLDINQVSLIILPGGFQGYPPRANYQPEGYQGYNGGAAYSSSERGSPGQKSGGGAGAMKSGSGGGGGGSSRGAGGSGGVCPLCTTVLAQFYLPYGRIKSLAWTTTRK
jgi:hypothetical protein